MEFKFNGMQRRDTFIYTQNMGIPQQMEWLGHFLLG